MITEQLFCLLKYKRENQPFSSEEKKKPADILTSLLQMLIISLYAKSNTETNMLLQLETTCIIYIANKCHSLSKS